MFTHTVLKSTAERIGEAVTLILSTRASPSKFPYRLSLVLYNYYFFKKNALTVRWPWLVMHTKRIKAKGYEYGTCYTNASAYAGRARKQEWKTRRRWSPQTTITDNSQAQNLPPPTFSGYYEISLFLIGMAARNWMFLCRSSIVAGEVKRTTDQILNLGLVWCNNAPGVDRVKK